MQTRTGQKYKSAKVQDHPNTAEIHVSGNPISVHMLSHGWVRLQASADSNSSTISNHHKKINIDKDMQNTQHKSRSGQPLKVSIVFLWFSSSGTWDTCLHSLRDNNNNSNKLCRKIDRLPSQSKKYWITHQKYIYFLCWGTIQDLLQYTRKYIASDFLCLRLSRLYIIYSSWTQTKHQALSLLKDNNWTLM